MSVLNTHLEQITAYARSIAELHFPPSKIFTNALLRSQDITALIRDIETHERALFSVAQPTGQQHPELSNSSRRATSYHVNEVANAYTGGAPGMRAPKRNTAVTAVLGKDLAQKIRRDCGGEHAAFGGKEKGEIDVEVLLAGAEKLCSVYPLPGSAEKITKLRQRHQQLISSIEKYEARAAEQAVLLSQINRARDTDFGRDEAEEGNLDEKGEPFMAIPQPIPEVKIDEEEIRELERKKHALEDRVSGMEKDLAGVLR